MLSLPGRYEALHRLGQGGGGEVWAVRDRVRGERAALKVLAKGAGAAELHALVREAVALSGLEGLGVPKVIGFGTLEGGRRYLVRELVEGRSLEDVVGDDDARAADWLEPLAHAAEQLTALHRAGLLHGDIKPANVIVGPDRRGTLVDLGLATPLREGGAQAVGLTPKYAAPEVLAGAPLTVRAEVYALGATLADGLARRGADLPVATRRSLEKVAARAREEDAKRRYPSTGELASALRRAAGLGPSEELPAWPVLGIDAPAQRLIAAARDLAPGEVLVVTGPPGAGKTTLLRRIAWTLGVEGKAVVEAPPLGAAPVAKDAVVVVDDTETLDAATRGQLGAALARGARAVVAGSEESARALGRPVSVFEVPPLEGAVARDLLVRAMPSLSETLAAHLVKRTGGRPGKLRAAVRALAGRPLVSTDDVDAALGREETSGGPASLDEVESLIDRGHVGEAERELARAGGGAGDDAVRVAIARSRLATGRGDARAALEALDAVATEARRGSRRRAWSAARARALLRAGRYPDVRADAEAAAAGAEDSTAAEALTTLGLALAFTGDDAKGTEAITRAVALARAANDRRVEGIALGSLAIVHQRASRQGDAKRAYEGALAAAEAARDAATVAATRLNLAALARAEGDPAAALGHLEAAVDLGRRAGGLLAVTQARLNLVNLDLYLGRHARARAAIEALRREGELGAPVLAQLAGCEAELAARTGDVARAAPLYEQCAAAYETQGRALDAVEARLEGLLVRAEAKDARAEKLLAELDGLRAGIDGGFGEHEPLAQLVRGVLATHQGDEAAAKRALDESVQASTAAGHQERAVWALEARARLHATQGNLSLARRDVDTALGMLEESASRLPRDLREVFWDDARRRALRHRASTTHPSDGAATSLFLPRPAEDKLARVLEVTRELATERRLPDLLRKVTDHALALLGGERGFVVLANEEGELLAHAARDREGDDPHAQFSRSVAEKVVRTGEPVVAIKAREDERLASAVSVHQLMIQSIACVPVRGAPPLGRPIGALYIETRLRPGLRFQEELPTLAAFADQAAIAIENARLLEENERRNAELEQKGRELEAAKERLADALGRRTEQLHATRRNLQQARAELRGHFGYAGLVGTSAAMRRVYALIDRIKDTDVPALVTGESGTGKEVVARAIHQAGPRAKKPFLGVNCGAIPANLLESELFGHVRGAFTGADRDRKGLFRETEGGTLLLDEIGEMPLKMQAGLLRVLQERTVRPVGGEKEEAVDVRVLAATNRDLEQMVAEGTFREDLYYRLNVIELHVPALRERSEDIPPLIDHFLTLFSSRYRRERKSVERDALRRLSAYSWPGNVRQLEHVLLNAWLMGEGKELVLGDFQLPDQSRPQPSRQARFAQNEEEFKGSERDRILRALEACNWNRVKAAQLTGIPRRTFYRRLKEFGIL